jgi:hypothetical protein
MKKKNKTGGQPPIWEGPYTLASMTLFRKGPLVQASFTILEQEHNETGKTASNLGRRTYSSTEKTVYH